ncbi:hypothetical protein QL285_083273 [Trifolium repens]|nr:hypothetical protein QL285_083273 [Trifolium repens]
MLKFFFVLTLKPSFYRVQLVPRCSGLMHFMLSIANTKSRLTEPELKLGETNRSSLISFLSFRLKIQTGFCQGWDAHVGYNSLFKLFKALKFYPCRSICSTAVKQAKSHKVREI